MLDMLKALVDVFVTVTIEPALVEHTAMLPKVALAVERETVWAEHKAARVATTNAPGAHRLSPRMQRAWRSLRMVIRALQILQSSCLGPEFPRVGLTARAWST